MIVAQHPRVASIRGATELVLVPARKADLLITNIKILFRGAIIDSGMAVKDGFILKFGKEPELPPSERRVNGKGRLVLPGAIDAHVHLRDQQLSYKETFETGTAAAVSGGVTTVLDMPNNKPPTNSLSNLQERERLATGNIYCNVGFFGAPNWDSGETSRLLEEGAFGLKVNMLKPIGKSLTGEKIRRAMDVAKFRDKVTVFHAEVGAEVRSTERKLKRSGRRTYEDFLVAHPTSSEVLATHKALSYAQMLGCRVHLAHVSSKASLGEILAARKAGILVTSEVSPHHLLLDSGKMRKLEGLGIMTPPLRTTKDCEVLRRALADGKIDAYASDHAPHSWSEKHSEDVWNISPGVSGLDTFMPLLLTHANSWGMTLQRLAKVTSSRPAEIFGLKLRGSLWQGYCADFIVVDTKVRQRIRAENFKSKAKFSPFEGWQLSASVAETYVGGECVFSDGEIVGNPRGSVLRSVHDGIAISPRRHAG